MAETVTLLAHRRIAGIAAFEDSFAPLQQKLDVSLPAAGRLIRQDGVLYLWAGPQAWLAVAEAGTPDFELQMAERCGQLAAVTAQGDGRAIIRVTSAAALTKLLPVDLHPSAFPPDATAMTLAGHIPVQIWHSPPDGFELACFRSYAETLYEALIEASRF